ncbi:hypothetical protein ADM99_16305 [Leptolinea tardivitalis]|uniref:Uncharacterized protein n=1 Tax=Leptolinea tardivitalis TaxID=229920 RepID=A0A0P6X8S0_9CHLR|nr:hypothetical protein ADM99_16305 [Leptolinea tardivitalis]
MSLGKLWVLLQDVLFCYYTLFLLFLLIVIKDDIDRKRVFLTNEVDVAVNISPILFSEIYCH